MATLLLVHAHPDDEAISTGGVMLKAKAHGHRVVLITATRGEVGEIYNMDEESSRPRLGEIRSEELKNAAEILGVDRQEFLGYRDRKSTRLNSSHQIISYAVFCLKKKNK